MLQNRQIGPAILIGLLIIICELSETCLGQGYSKNYRNPQQTSNRQSQNYQNAPGAGTGAVPPQNQTNSERRHTAKQMLKFMNLEQDPCNDFYDYACGNWMQSQNISDEAQDGDLMTVTNSLEQKVIELLQKRLDDASRSPSVVNRFYRSCFTTNWNEQKLFIKNFVERYGGLPDIADTWREGAYQWIEILARLKLDFNLNILIVFENTANSKAILKESQNTILPAELCNADASADMDEKDEIFQVIQKEIKENLKSWFDFSDNDAARLAGDIQRFEFDLCKYLRKEELLELSGVEGNSDDDTTIYSQSETRPMNKFNTPQGGVRNMNPKLANYKNSNDLENNQKLINFVLLCLRQPQGQGGADFEIQNAEYLQYLTSISGRKPSFAYYIMYRALSELTLPLELRQTERKLFCVQKTMQIFPDYLGNIYQMTIPAHLREFIKQDVASIFRDIKEAIPRTMRKHIEALQISEPLYQGSGDSTFANIKTNGNYWEILKTVIASRSQQQTGVAPKRGRTAAAAASIPNVVEAFSTAIGSNEKILQFGWALLQPPFYAYNYPKSLKYSSLGYAIARELLKRHVDEQNLEVKTSNFNQQLEEFNANRECFRSQVSSYLFNTPEVYRNGTQLREIIADSSALSVAFLAYNNWLEKQNAIEPELKLETLPQMHLTNTQLFFVNYAQSRCADRYAEQPAKDSKSFPMDLHTAERLNVNGPLSNDGEFGLDFNCDIGTDMNLADKCSIMSDDFKRGY